jgi:DNA-binding NarL/FixJ family response regulator
MLAGPGIRVMLVDSHRLVLHGLQRVIDDEKPQLSVVATAITCASAVELVHRAAPDVVVLDSKLAAEDQAAVVPELINGRNTKVLLLGASELPQEEALLRGACGVVHKEDTPDVLIKAIRKVYAGELWLERSITGRLFVELSRRNGSHVAPAPENKLDLLTCREQEVVRTLVTRPGADNKTLAATLHIGEHTLRNHLSRIYDKVGVPNRLELYVLARGSNGGQRV